MKKICLFVLGISAAVLSFAQSEAKFGLKGGLNVSTLNRSNYDFGSRIGVHIGGLAHVHLAPEWALQPEILYSQEGSKRNGVTTKLDYINIPLMLQYMFSNGFRIEAGPQLGLLVNGKYEDNGSGVQDDRAKSDFKTTNVSLGAGLNYLSHTGLGVGGRYNFGLSDISESELTKVKGNTFQVSVFYLFDHMHKAHSK